MIKTNIVISPAPGISHDTSSAQHMIKMNQIIYFIYILFVLMGQMFKYDSLFNHFLNGERSRIVEKIDIHMAIHFMQYTNKYYYKCRSIKASA
jgi:hypothetical protein